MLDTIASSPSLVGLFVAFAVGAVGAFAARNHDRLANIWTTAFAMLGSAWGMVFAASILLTGKVVAFGVATSIFSSFSTSVRVDKLSAFFIFVICLIAFLCSLYGSSYIKEYYRRYSIGALGFFYNLFILGMLLVVTAANGLWFLVAWEIISLATYFLVVYDRDRGMNIKAGYIYLIMTHMGAACILLALAFLYGYTHSFDFEVIKAHIAAVPQTGIVIVFGLSLIGLGTKAGMVPFHIWLPSAHPAAPSHVSALMSGVMIKTAIYMMIRLFLDILEPIPLWCGAVVLGLGALSAVIGVLYALTEHDIKRLLAYHSIENIGIIMLGLGSALVFSSLHRPGLVILSLAAALFHTLNHAVFKALLFLGAGAVVQTTHTRNIERYGGLIKLLPATGLFFLVGVMAISALPPLNGFFSEWLTFQSLFSGMAQAGGYVKWVFIAAAVALAMAGGLALACFVKAFGAGFLARPRSDAAKQAKEAPWLMLASMACLALLCMGLGFASAPIARVMQNVAHQTTGLVSAVGLTANSSLFSISVGHPVSSVSGPIVVAMAMFVTAGVWLGVRYGVHRRQEIRLGQTWDCGASLNERMEITASGFSHSLVRIFGALLRPSLQHIIDKSDSAASTSDAFQPESRKVLMRVRDIYQDHLYMPVYRAMFRLSQVARRLHHGNLNVYILYIFVVMVAVLVARD